MKTLIVILLCLRVFLADGQALDSTSLRAVDSLIARSRQHTGARNFEEALRIAERAQEQAATAFGMESAAYAAALFNLGRIYYFTGAMDEAEQFYIQAKNIRERVSGKLNPDYAACLNNLGLLYWQTGRYPEALKMHLEAKDIREKLYGKEHPDYALSLNNLAIVYFDMGFFDEAEKRYLEAKAIREKTLGTAHIDYAQSLNNLANLYNYLSRFEDAEPLFLQALHIWETQLGKDHPNYAITRSNLANLYNYTGRFEAAEILYQEAIEIYGRVEGKENLNYVNSLNNLASLYTKMGRYEEAVHLYLAAKEILEKISGNDHQVYVRSLNGLALLYTNMGQYPAAENLFLKAISIQETILGKEDRDYGVTLNNLAILYCNIGRYDSAERYYLQALSIRGKVLGGKHPDYAETLINLGNLYRDIKKYAAADSVYREAKTIEEEVLGKTHPDYADCLINMAYLYQEMGRLETAVPLYLEAQTISNTRLSSSSRFLSDRELSSYVQLSAKTLDAYYSVALGTQGAYPDFASGCYDNALLYKGFLLNVAARINRLAASDTAASRLNNLLKSYYRRLATEYARPISEREKVVELEEKANVTEKQLVRTIAAFDEVFRQVRWQEVQAALKPGEAAIEFIHYQYCNPLPTDTVLYAALVLLPGNPEFSNPLLVPLFEASQLERLLPHSNDPDRIDDFYNTPTGSAVYTLIWQPLDKVLEQVTKVYCAPSGLLHRINLAAIPVNSSQTFADRRHLVLLGSTRQLLSAGSNSSAGTAVLFGNINYDADTTAIPAKGMASDTANALILAAQGTMLTAFPVDSTTRAGGVFAWKPLPATAVEVQNIAALLQEQQFKFQLFTGSAATEEVFKQLGRFTPAPSILHLATHGYVFADPERTLRQPTAGESSLVFKSSDLPMIRSGLILAGANTSWISGRPPAYGEDGILTAYEISQQNLTNTELVVLSACESGLGQIEGNEGVYGLQRAFKIAGAKYLIMSLWQISDQRTGELMTGFYHHFLDQHLPVPEAFRLAQQEMRVTYPGSPYVWAGFVLVE